MMNSPINTPDRKDGAGDIRRSSSRLRTATPRANAANFSKGNTSGNTASDGPIPDQFIWWLLGYDVEFPFYKDKIEVKLPEGFEDTSMEFDEWRDQTDFERGGE